MTAIIADNIKRLGLREFQRAMYEHIRQPEPIILEKFKKPHLVLLPYHEYMKLREASASVLTPSPFTLSGMARPDGTFNQQKEDHFKPTRWQEFKKFLNTKLF